MVSTCSVARPVLTSESRTIVRVRNPGTREQHDADGDLRHDDRALQALLAQAAAHRCAPAGNRTGERPFLRQRRDERQQQRDRHRQRERESQHHAVELDLAGARRVTRGEREEQRDSADRDRRRRRAHEGEHEILGQQQAPQPRVGPPRAPRGPRARAHGARRASASGSPRWLPR